MFFLEGNKGGEKGRKEVYIIIFKRKGNDLLYRKKGKTIYYIRKGKYGGGNYVCFRKTVFYYRRLNV